MVEKAVNTLIKACGKDKVPLEKYSVEKAEKAIAWAKPICEIVKSPWFFLTRLQGEG